MQLSQSPTSNELGEVSCLNAAYLGMRYCFHKGKKQFRNTWKIFLVVVILYFAYTVYSYEGWEPDVVPDTVSLVGEHILVTGAAGFIGFHTAQRLKDLGMIPIGYDVVNHYYDVNLKEARIKILEEKGIELIRGDLCDEDTLTKTFDKYNFKYILHLAAQAGVRYSLDHPLEYVRANVQCFTQLLEVARKRPRLPTVVYASSSSVYGANTKVPFEETDRVEQQRSFYGATKRSNELLARVYNDLYGMKLTGLRFFTVYGPFGRPDMAYYKWSHSIVDGQPLKLYNHGDMKRDFTFISDIVDGIVGALALGADLEVFNLGRGHVRDLMDLVHALEKGLGTKAKLEFTDTPGGEVLITYADTSKAKRMLGYSPKVQLEEGIAIFMDWWREYYQKDKGLDN